MSYLIKGPKGNNARNSRTTFPDVARRAKRADERLKARSALTPDQQLRKLDDRLGVGQGAMKERARLNKEILKAETLKNERIAAQEKKAENKAKKLAEKSEK